MASSATRSNKKSESKDVTVTLTPIVLQALVLFRRRHFRTLSMETEIGHLVAALVMHALTVPESITSSVNSYANYIYNEGLTTDMLTAGIEARITNAMRRWK